MTTNEMRMLQAAAHELVRRKWDEIDRLIPELAHRGRIT
jgi:hypothetical protein